MQSVSTCFNFFRLLDGGVITIGSRLFPRFLMKRAPQFVKELQPSTTFLPIFGTNAGIVKLVRDLQARKARSPI
jgi:hypothetical protein